MIRKVNFRILLGTLPLCLLPVQSPAQVTLDRIIAKSDAMKSKLTKAYAEYSHTTTYQEGFLKEDSDYKGPRSAHSERNWGFDGEKQRLTRMEKGFTPQTDLQTPNDGYVTYDPLIGLGEGAIFLSKSRQDFNTSTLLDFGYVIDRHWLGDFLRAGSFKVQSSNPSAPEVSGVGSDGGKYVITLATAKDDLIATRVDKVYSTGDEYVFSVATTQESEGFTFPKTAAMQCLKNGVPVYRIDVSVTKFTANNVPAGYFDLPRLAPGSKVKDDREGINYDIGPMGEHIQRGKIGNPAHKAEKSGAMFAGWLFVGGVVTLVSGGVFALGRRKFKEA